MRTEINFTLYNGPLMGLPTNKNHLVFRWDNEDCNVLFSVARQGNAASCHFASDKKGLRHIKKAINEWCDFIAYVFDWCEMIIAKIDTNNSGVIKISEKCNFLKVWGNNTISVYMRGIR